MNRIIYVIIVIGSSFLIAMALMNIFLTIDYCWNGGVCLSIQGGESDGALIIPWIVEIRILIESIINPGTWVLTIMFIPIVAFGGSRAYEWWVS